MDWVIWLPIAISAIGVGLSYWQVRIMKQQIASLPHQKNKRVEQEKQLLRRLYTPVIIMAILVVLAWVPYFLTTPSAPPDPVSAWGMDAQFVPSRPVMQMLVNQDGLAKYRAKYRMVAVAFHYYGDGDVKDTTGLQKSGLFDIGTGQQKILIRPGDEYTQALLKGDHGTFYALLLVPNGITLAQFSTLREAQRLGALDISDKIGPP